MNSVRSPWGVFLTCVVVWEAVAALTEDAQEAGALGWHVPYITDVVRRLPQPLRLAYVVGISIALLEHTERMLYTKRALGFLMGAKGSVISTRGRSWTSYG